MTRSPLHSSGPFWEYLLHTVRVLNMNTPHLPHYTRLVNGRIKWQLVARINRALSYTPKLSLYSSSSNIV